MLSVDGDRRRCRLVVGDLRAGVRKDSLAAVNGLESGRALGSKAGTPSICLALKTV